MPRSAIVRDAARRHPAEAPCRRDLRRNRAPSRSAARATAAASSTEPTADARDRLGPTALTSRRSMKRTCNHASASLRASRDSAQALLRREPLARSTSSLPIASAVADAIRKPLRSQLDGDSAASICERQSRRGCARRTGDRDPATPQYSLESADRAGRPPSDDSRATMNEAMSRSEVDVLVIESQHRASGDGYRTSACLGQRDRSPSASLNSHSSRTQTHRPRASTALSSRAEAYSRIVSSIQ